MKALVLAGLLYATGVTQAPAQNHTLMSGSAMSGASFEECMRRSEATLRKTNFSVQRGSKAISGTTGTVTAQILCLPGNQHVTIVVGPDRETAEAFMKSIVETWQGKT